MTDNSDLAPWFLGPYGENDEVFERTVVEFLRDHVYWRRNFHPEDPPPISTLAASSPDYVRAIARMKRELHALSAALKRSVPFSSPRYIGHMASDLLLPGLIAQLVTLPYNPNNIVEDAAPVTLELELEVGLQLARMLGYATDATREDRAFGHLTSGGTVANYEALWVLRALKFLPLALRDAAAGTPAADVTLADGRRLADADVWTLLNLTVAETLALRAACLRAFDPARRALFRRDLERSRIEHLGIAAFCARHGIAQMPVVLAPVTAHYSWEKAMKLLGLGTAQLVPIPTRGMRLDPAALEELLAALEAEKRPVLAVIGVFGTTEFGTLDPIHRIVAARTRWQERGLRFAVHVDAAWGGYLVSLFRAPDGSLRPHEAVRASFRYFPSQEVYDTVAALSEADSITVDPHKLGYIPFGAGAVVYRDQRMLDVVAQQAAYVFGDETVDDTASNRFHALGRYVLEGSKPGASAAAAYVAHRTLPLDHENFGRITAATIRNTERFYDRLHALSQTLRGRATLTVPFEPDTNLICLAINPAGNRSVAGLNRFGRRIFEHLRVDAERPVQTRQFFGSFTLVGAKALGSEASRVLAELGLDPATLRDPPRDPEHEAAGLFMLRHTLMNPWLCENQADIDYLELYCRYLEKVVLETLAHHE